MAKKKTSQEIEETSLGNDDLIRISKESGGSYSNRKIKGSNMKASLRGYKSFVGAISQSNYDHPTIDSTYVNDWGIESGDCSYVDEGTYQITKRGIGINFANQNGVGVQTNSSWHITAVDDDTLELTTFKNGLPINGGFTNTLIDLKFPL